MILVRRKSQVETSKVMKGGINFELKADNIIHAPVDTPKHFINIFKILPDGKKKAYVRKKEKTWLLRETQHEGQEWLVFLLVCLCDYADFHPRKGKMCPFYFFNKSELPWRLRL